MLKLKVKVESMEHDNGVLVEDKLDRLEEMLVSKRRPHLGGEFQPFFAKWWDLLDLS